MAPIRVLIIEDSAFMRKMISEILGSDDRIHVLGTARNGEDGLKKIKLLSPDVVTLDVEMPVMDGITTLEKIMETNPLPVVMLSSLTSKGASKTVKAISIGAVDFITKPSGSISLDIDRMKDEIISKVVMASQTRVKKVESIGNSTLNKVKIQQFNDIKETRPQQYNDTIVVIGTSTGGPRALQQTLTALPSDFPAPILIVQHMPPNFTKSLADRLNTLSKIDVREAVHGEVIQKGVAYIAPGDYHMLARKVGRSYAIELTKDPQVNGHRPAVDVLFDSFARVKQVNKIAVVLTGMGKDGAVGIRKIKEIDTEAIVIAEAEESSVVYGMPAAAVDTKCVNLVVHLNKVGETINDLVNRSGRA